MFPSYNILFTVLEKVQSLNGTESNFVLIPIVNVLIISNPPHDCYVLVPISNL